MFKTGIFYRNMSGEETIVDILTLIQGIIVQKIKNINNKIV